jgi:asparagine synthase (glutamine-hydrolysing)
MTAYEKWGAEGFARLVGDWSVAVWDAPTLVLASDYMGVRGLYYHVDQERLVWSTTLGALVAETGCREDLEPRFIAGWLMGAVPPDVTPYRAVHAVSPAHVLAWSRDRNVQKRRIWQFPVRTISCRDSSAEVYAESLRSIFREAVKTRLRLGGAVWASLSGGFDSTSVVCMADWLMRSHQVESRRLETVSWISDSSPESDERPFIAVVQDYCDRPGHYVRTEDCADLIDEKYAWITPDFVNGVLLATLRLVQHHGAKVLLTGRAGDAVMGNFVEFPGLIATSVAAGKPLTALADARGQARATGKTIWQVGLEAALLLGGASTQSWLRARAALPRGKSPDRNMKRRAAAAFIVHPTLIDWWYEELARQTGRLAAYPLAMHPVVDSLLGWADTRSFETPAYCPAVTSTHPFTHRPLVEFMLSLPPARLCPAGQPRFLMKTAFAPFLPGRVAARFSKGYAAASVTRELRATTQGWADRANTLRVVQSGFVDRDRLKSSLTDLAGGSTRRLGTLIAVTRLERWLEIREKRRDRELARAG